MGEAPPVPMAATTSPRSMTAGVVKSQSAGRSTTLTGTLAARAAFAAASAKVSSALAMKARAAPS